MPFDADPFNFCDEHDHGGSELRQWAVVSRKNGLPIPVCEYYAVVKNEFDRLLCDVRNRQELPLAGHG